MNGPFQQEISLSLAPVLFAELVDVKLGLPHGEVGNAAAIEEMAEKDLRGKARMLCHGVEAYQSLFWFTL